MNLVQFKMNSSIGPLYFVASSKGLQRLLWEYQEDVALIKDLNQKSPEVIILKEAVKEIEEFLLGKRKKFELKLDADGTEFQKKVWRELCKIPYGNTVSYKAIAEKIGTKAVRAVGSANARNPLSIIVPCHRVITSSGKLGGYSGGLELKKHLLELEQRSAS